MPIAGLAAYRFHFHIGTNSVSQAVTSKLQSNFQVPVTCLVSGLRFGLWEIWDGRAMVHLLMALYVTYDSVP